MYRASSWASFKVMSGVTSVRLFGVWLRPAAAAAKRTKLANLQIILFNRQILTNVEIWLLFIVLPQNGGLA